MKFYQKILLCIAFLTFSHQAVNGCSATVSPCNETCTITAPPQGSSSCYTEDGVAYCKSYDENDHLIQTKTASCGSSGGGGTPGGNGAPDFNCQIYWWTCSVASY